MDRDALVLRNRAMAEAFHQPPLKHRARHAALLGLANLPFIARRIEGERILLLRPDHLGDVLLSTPAINALRAAHPDAEIHALVGPWAAEVVANFDSLDAVITLNYPGFSRTPQANWRSPYEQAFRAAGQLRRIGYSAAIILRPDHWWGALLARLAGIPRRIGYDREDTRLFVNQRVPFRHEHVVMQNTRLVQAYSGDTTSPDIPLEFPVRSEDDYWVQGYLEEWDVEPVERLLAIHPGSGTWVKRWDEARWALVADALHEQLGVHIIFTGADHELPMVSQIVAQMKHTPTLMVGDATIGQLAALYKRCTAVLGPDSGPLHLAASVGTATVTLFGPADPVEFGPWGNPDRHVVLASSIGCRPCRVIDWGTDDPANHPCIRDITVERVLDAARRLIQRDRF